MTFLSSHNLKIYCVDATANLYIVELTIRDCPGPVTAAEMTKEGHQAGKGGFGSWKYWYYIDMKLSIWKLDFIVM
jgi:hypothetical protein